MGIIKKGASAAIAQTNAKFEDEPAADTNSQVSESNENTQPPAAVTRDSVAAEKVDAKPQVTEPEVESQPETKADPKPEAKADTAAAQAAVNKAAEPKPKTTTALTTARPSGLKPGLLSGGAAVSPLKDCEGALFNKHGIQATYDMFPRLRLEAGVLTTKTGKEAGDYVELQVISWDYSWAVSTGKDDDKSAELVRFSKDGENLDVREDDEHDCETCAEYQAYLVKLGYEDAKVRQSINVTGVALDAEKKDFAHMNEMVVVGINPSAIKDWLNYMATRILAVKMKKIKETHENPVVRFTAKREKGKKNVYFSVEMSHGLAAPIDTEEDEVEEAAAE